MEARQEEMVEMLVETYDLKKATMVMRKVRMLVCVTFVVLTFPVWVMAGVLVALYRMARGD